MKTNCDHLWNCKCTTNLSCTFIIKWQLETFLKNWKDIWEILKSISICKYKAGEFFSNRNLFRFNIVAWKDFEFLLTKHNGKAIHLLWHFFLNSSSYINLECEKEYCRIFSINYLKNFISTIFFIYLFKFNNL